MDYFLRTFYQPKHKKRFSILKIKSAFIESNDTIAD